jgi:hypothetical protein
MRAGLSQLKSDGEHRGAFTLIEVLVSLALTLIMMALFAQIFQITGNFVTRNKGIAENDQSARILTTVLKNDLQNRTMRYLAPLHPNMSALADDSKRTGYFYYSENNPLDDTDDVLQFTISIPLTNPTTQLPNPPQFGLATFLPKQQWQAATPYALGAYVTPTTGSQTGFIYCATVAGASGVTQPTWPTTLGLTVVDGGVTWQCVDSTLQPDGDDAIVYYLNGAPAAPVFSVMNPTTTPPTAPNNTGASQFAEVTYFLRHGNLYRRVLLVREPYNTTSGGTQPGTTAYPIINGPYAGNFWTDFDYSARYGVIGASNGPLFFDQTDLSNAPSATYTAGTYPLGRPDSRFGFDQTNGSMTLGPATSWPTVGQTGNGAPREYDSAGVFFGRFTDEETSNAAFGFPGFLPGGVSPMAQATTGNVNTTTGGVTQYTGTPIGARRGEDILLTNVVSFDVKLWDNHYSEAAGFDLNRNGLIDPGPAFADVGHGGATGDFRQANNALPSYGPHASQTQNAPPNANTFTAGGVTYYNNVFDTWYRAFNFDNVAKNYDAADSTAPNNLNAAAPYRPRLGVPWQPSTAYAVGAVVDPLNTANGYVYTCVTAGTSQATASLPAGQPDPFSLSDPIGAPILSGAPAGTDGTVVWNAGPPVAVQAIQITIKYLDPTQNLLRQVTIVQQVTQ